MRKTLLLFLILVVSVAIQAAFLSHFVWAPDIVLIIVLFAGIFLRLQTGLWVALAAGFLRGCFSPDALFLNMMMFPLLAVSAGAFAGAFYKHDPGIQLFTVAMATVIMILAHTFYVSRMADNAVNLSYLLRVNIWHIATTVIISPLIFLLLKIPIKMKE